MKTSAYPSSTTLPFSPGSWRSGTTMQGEDQQYRVTLQALAQTRREELQRILSQALSLADILVKDDEEEEGGNIY
jgi:hypothetical protein